MQDYSTIQLHYNRAILYQIERHPELAGTTHGLAYALLSDLLRSATNAGLQDKPAAHLAAALMALPVNTPTWRLPLPDLPSVLNFGSFQSSNLFATPEQATGFLQGFFQTALSGLKPGLDEYPEDLLARVCGCSPIGHQGSFEELAKEDRMESLLDRY